MGLPFLLLTPNVLQSCALEWPEVLEDGNSPIYGYDVFLRKNKGDWERVNDEMVFTQHYIVPNIEAGLSYEFKIEATNEAGLTSNSNISSEPVTISKTGWLLSSLLIR